MRRFLVILLLLVGQGLYAQSPAVVVQGEELASGVYSHDFIDVICTVPSSWGIVAYVNGQKQSGSSEKGARPGTRRVRISNLPEVEYEKCRIRLEFTDRSGKVIDVKEFKKAHDRFLIIDHQVYLIGSSIKDLGKKWFGVTLMETVDAEELITKLEEN